jgi:hypothetical protein
MIMGIDKGEVLHPVEVELLCTFAEVEAPFPLEVPSSGETEVERLVMYAGASDMMVDRGLADRDGPLGVADDFVYLLHNATGVLDLVLVKDRIVFGAAVLSYRDEALLVTQDFTEPDKMIRMKAVTLDDAVEDLLRLIPARQASVTAPFNVPRHAVQEVYRAMRSRMPAPVDPDADVSDSDAAAEITAEIKVPKPLPREDVDELLRSHGLDERVVRRMVSQLQPVLGSGQAGVAKRDDTEDQWHRVGEELRWLDTERAGRFRLAEDGEWISVNPLTPDEMRAGLRRLAAMIRG